METQLEQSLEYAIALCLANEVEFCAKTLASFYEYLSKNPKIIEGFYNERVNRLVSKYINDPPSQEDSNPCPTDTDFEKQ